MRRARALANWRSARASSNLIMGAVGKGAGDQIGQRRLRAGSVVLVCVEDQGRDAAVSGVGPDLVDPGARALPEVGRLGDARGRKL
jgi:hypothetical protein